MVIKFIMMKKIMTMLLLAVAVTAGAQTKGKFEVFDFKNFKLHVYNTNDALGDASYIVEGGNGLVTLEHPLFKDNIAEFNAYLKNLNKPVAKIIGNYHTGGSADVEGASLAMYAGMPEFEVGDIYGGMMKGFATNFGDAIDVRPHGKPTVVAKNATENWAGVSFKFTDGASSDFPAADINIGEKVFYTHWTPAKSHLNALQIPNAAAIDAKLAEAEKAKKSSCELFIGGHGGAAKIDALDFYISYLKKMKQLRKTSTNAESFASQLVAAFPNIPGADGVKAVADAIYK